MSRLRALQILSQIEMDAALEHKQQRREIEQQVVNAYPVKGPLTLTLTRIRTLTLNLVRTLTLNPNPKFNSNPTFYFSTFHLHHNPNL